MDVLDLGVGDGEKDVEGNKIAECGFEAAPHIFYKCPRRLSTACHSAA